MLSARRRRSRDARHWVCGVFITRRLRLRFKRLLRGRSRLTVLPEATASEDEAQGQGPGGRPNGGDWSGEGQASQEVGERCAASGTADDDWRDAAVHGGAAEVLRRWRSSGAGRDSVRGDPQHATVARTDRALMLTPTCYGALDYAMAPSLPLVEPTFYRY